MKQEINVHMSKEVEIENFKPNGLFCIETPWGLRFHSGLCHLGRYWKHILRQDLYSEKKYVIEYVIRGIICI